MWKNSGINCNVEKLDDSEFLAELEKKLVEELADILEVIYRISELRGTNSDTLDKIRQDKAEKRGGFEKNLFLIDSSD
ncbi:MAG: hypothetical protein MAG458_01346 [Nitrosopumilus sp.]|nr:hypothetical protein [Nitrosopumilus sp.]